jgi:hypothetical protein
MLRTLSQDDTPMVRRAAAQNLGAVAEAVDQRVVSQDVCPIFLKLTQDGASAAASRPPFKLLYIGLGTVESPLSCHLCM